MNKRYLWRFTLMAAVASCNPSNRILQPIFVDGRAVEAVGDSIVAFTTSDTRGLLVRDRQADSLVVLGAESLSGPVHVQFLDGEWYVSEMRDGAPSITVLDRDGEFRRRISLDNLDATPHQFAVLPDGRIVVEIPGGVLLALSESSADTFALTDETEGRSGFLVAGLGGLLHALPDHHITLYNGFGTVRWRVEWPWRPTAYVTDLTIDANGRPHVIAGIESTEDFVVYTFSTITGEIIRWSQPGPYATFMVEKLGELRPDSVSNWTN